MASQIGIFDELREEAHGRDLSIRWYRQKVQELLPKPQVRRMIREGYKTQKVTVRPNFGMMNLFYYRPKGAEKLPYYDTFPLVLPIEKYPDGFLGINFHYLPIPLRIRLLDKLVDFSNNTKFDESTILTVDYSRLKKINLIKPTIHRYLAGYTMSQFRRIDADEFTVATLLPVQRFKKASASAVWKESRSMI